MPTYIVETDLGTLEIDAVDETAALNGAKYYLAQNGYTSKPKDFDLSMFGGSKKDEGFFDMLGRGVTRGAKQTGSLLGDVFRR